MNSLRARIVVLGALMALGASVICAVAAVQVARGNLISFEERQADQAVAALRARLVQAYEGIGFEVNDYGNWDELHAQMPTPTPEWARINLTPGKIPGAFTQYMITADDRRITGRYHDGDVRSSQPSTRDPATATALATLLGSPHQLSGLAVLAGNPALFAVTPVRQSNRQGEPRGHLIALAYLDDEVLKRLQPDGWLMRTAVEHRRESHPVTTPPTWGSITTQRDGDRLVVATTLTTHDGRLDFTLSTNRAAGQRLGERTAIAILLAGLCSAGAALLVGTWLGWRWLAPITALADACRNQVTDPQVDLPSNSGLTEADVLSDNLRQLVMRLRLGQDELAHALDRESATNAMHRRFLTQLGHEFGQPIRRIIDLCEQMERRSGRLEPEEVAAAKALADDLEQRFQEILTLVGPADDQTPTNRPQGLRDYADGLAALMRSQADKAGVTLVVDAPTDAIALDPGLLSPVLINLLANAVHAGRPGGTVWLKAQLDTTRGEIWWTVKDNGPGLPDHLLERVREAFIRGEVLPGTPGIGMGLTLALANVRMLNGTMSLLNQADPGVTILVRLPLGNGRRGSTPTASERIRRPG